MGELVTLDLNPATKDTEPAKPKPQEPAPKPKPKPTAPKDKSPLPVKAPSKPPKLSTIPKRVDVGDQMVGSRHLYSVATVVNVGNQVGPTSGHALVEGPMQCYEVGEEHAGRQTRIKCEPDETPFFTDWTVPRSLDEAPVLEVGFAPIRTGRFEGLLRFVANLGNGSLEEHRVEVAGRAIDHTTVPTHRPGQPEPSKRPGEIAPADRRLIDTVPEHVLQELEHRAKNAGNAAAALADAQRDGVANVESTISAYERKKPSPGAPWWLDLAEVAISIGVAGVAGAVARHLATTLASDLSRSWAAHKDAMQHLGVTDAIKDGIKTSGKLAVSAGKSAIGGASSPLTNYARAQFFQEQRAVLTRVSTNNRDMVEKTRYRLQPHLATDPEATLKAMEVVQESLSKAHGDATSVQQEATEQRWISGIAHESNSHMTSQAPDGEVVHRTGMRVARRGADRDGILTLKVVAHDEDVGRAGALEVRGASLEGVPQPMADHLKTHALADLPIPIMLEVSGAIEARITRDEVGIIELTGTGGKWFNNPAQNHKLASEIVRRILERKLSGWAVKNIKTDDAASR